jgi:hypothetical protein
VIAAAEDLVQVPAEEVPLLRIAVVVARDSRHPEWLSVALRSVEGSKVLTVSVDP